jgi:hypothetical protein
MHVGWTSLIVAAVAAVAVPEGIGKKSGHSAFPKRWPTIDQSLKFHDE